MKTLIITDFNDELNVKLHTLKRQNIELKAELDNAKSESFHLKKELSTAQNSIEILKNQLRVERERHAINKEANEMLKKIEQGKGIFVEIGAKECKVWA